MSEEKRSIVEVDGVQIFSADFVFSQMSYQSRRIDRARNIALVSAGVTVFALIIALIAIAL